MNLHQTIRCLPYNLFPSYRSTGAWIDYIADDWHEVKIRLPLNWHTRNSVGTLFCGSMYSAIAPWYMGMLVKILGKDYLVWDKVVKIDFKKPGQTTLFAHFVIAPDEVASIRTALESRRSLERSYTINLVDEKGLTHVAFEELIYIRVKR